MWMLSHAMDAGAQGLMREYVALTVACIDQSNLDGHGSMAYTLSLLEEPPNQVFCDRDDSHWQTFLTAGPGSLGVDRSLFCEGAGGAEHKEAGDKDPKGQPKGRESTESHVTTEKTEVSQTSKGCARSAADSATVTPLQCGAVPDACSMPAPQKRNKKQGRQGASNSFSASNTDEKSCLPPPGGRSPHRAEFNRAEVLGSDPSANVPDAAEPQSKHSHEDQGNSMFKVLRDTGFSYPKWCTELVSLVLRTRTPFSAFLATCIRLTRASRNSKRSTPTFYPVPLPFFGIFHRMPSGSSASVRHTRHVSQAIHTIICALNFWYAGGRHGDLELLRREPNAQHRALYARLHSLIESDSPASIASVPSAGRRFPELSARLSELSDFLTAIGPTSNPYEKSFAGFGIEKDDTVDAKLQPYHDLDPSMIKIHAVGDSGTLPISWRMTFTCRTQSLVSYCMVGRPPLVQRLGISLRLPQL